MASAATIGALRVVFGADTASLEKGMKGASSSLSDFAGAAKGAGIAIGAALSAAVVGVAIGVRGVLQEMDKLTKMGRAIGVPVEELSALRHAADLSGVSIETLGKGMQKLAKNMMDAASDSAGMVAQAFNSIGVAVKNSDGTLRNSTAVMVDISKKFADMEDGAGKTALAMALFGKSGAGFINMLNGGKVGLQAMIDEAKELGLVISKDVGESAERFNDNVTRIHRVLDGLWIQLTAKILPTLEVLAQRFVDFAKEGSKNTGIIDDIATAFRGMIKVADRVIMVWGMLKALASNVWEGFTKSGDELIEHQKKLWDKFYQLAAEYQKKQSDLDWAPKVTVDPNSVQKSAAPIIKSAKDVAEALAGVRAELQAFVSDPGNEMVQKIAMVEEAFKKGTITVAQHTMMLQKLKNEGFKELRDEAKAAFDLLLSMPSVSFADKMAAVNAAVAEGTLKMKDYGKTVKAINDENKKNMLDLASATASALTSIFGDNKAAAIAAAIINTAVGITKAMELPPPFSWAQAALVAATGVAQIAAIKKTNSKSSGGSAPSVRGGSGGTGQPAVDPQQQSLFVQGINPNDLFRGDVVRGLAETLLKYQKDGGKVILQ